MLARPAVANDAQSSSSTLGELHFRFDSAALMADAPGVLDKVTAYTASNPDAKIVLDAHCDPIGTSDYNVGLAIRRAESVRDQLKVMGVPEDRIVFAVYGEDGARRASHADDRRVTLWATSEPLARVIDQTLAANGNAVTWYRPQTVAQIEGRSQVASREITVPEE
jgi:outer membrane protein OmpA-like peptidoglycan-associated protein